MQVTAFFEQFPHNQAIADQIWQQVSDFSLYMGNLVAENRQVTLVVVELIDEAEVEV